jgi:hypothetical protein
MICGGRRKHLLTFESDSHRVIPGWEAVPAGHRYPRILGSIAALKKDRARVNAAVTSLVYAPPTMSPVVRGLTA